MKYKRCTKPGCGNTYNENSFEYEDGFCECGAILEEVQESTVTPIPIADLLDSPTETPRFDKDLVEETEAYDEGNQKDEEENDTYEESSIPYDEDFSDEEEYIEDSEDIKEVETKEIVEEETAAAIPTNLPKYVITHNNQIIFQNDENFMEVYKQLNQVPKVEDPDKDYKGDRIEMYLDNKVYRTYRLESDEFVIGRESIGEVPELDYSEIDVNRFISRRHALIYRQQNEFYIRNLSTKNSVHVNKEALSEKQFRKLEDGDKIVLSQKYGLIFKKASECED